MSGLLPPGYLMFDGQKYVLVDDINLQGPPGPSNSVPTGSGYPHFTNGVLDPVASNIILNSQATGVLPAINQAPQTLGGGLTGSTASGIVLKINGASVPAAGALSTGSALLVSSPTALSYGAINLANSNAVAGILGSTNGGLGSSNGTLTNGILAGTPNFTAAEIEWNGDTNSKRSAIDLIGSLLTTNASPAVSTLFTVSANTLYSVDVLVTATTSNIATRAVYKVSAVVYGNSTPTANLDGSVVSNGTGTSSGSLAATIITSGTSVELQVTGASSTSIRWGFEAHISALVH